MTKLVLLHKADSIRSVEHNGSDSLRNGLALSGTLHWIFDRGLISVANDGETILVSCNKASGAVVDRLLGSEGMIWMPEDERNWPHPANLAWHRENVFGQMAADGPAPWN